MTEPYRDGCFLAREGIWEREPEEAMPPCSGPWQKAHLIAKFVLRREGLDEHRWDQGTWVWACLAHHGAFDFSRTIRIPRDRIPPSTEQFAAKHGLTWYLDRNYKAYKDHQEASHVE